MKREEENIARTKEFVEAAAIVQARAHDIGSAKAAAERVKKKCGVKRLASSANLP